MEQSQKDTIISTLKNDLLPLFEESKFDEGVKKVKNIIKDLEE